MKPDSSFDELTRLTSLFLDGELPDAEMARLTELIGESEDAHTRFVHLCELHAMLDSEPAIQAVLSEKGLPENVVALPGSSTAATRPVLEDGTENRSLWLAIGAAAAVVIGALFLFNTDRSGANPVESNSDLFLVEEPIAPAPPVEEIETIETDEDKPERQYDRAVLASLGSGSQQRPPTNFTVEPAAHTEISFNRDIRPLLSENCYHCHGPDEAGRKADLRLDTFAGVTAGDYPAIVPGKPEESEMVTRMLSTDEDDIMPPPESHKSLKAPEIALLTKWIEQGAVWEGHWSFSKIENPLPEDVTSNAIDYFVDQKLATVGLTRSPAAGRETLARRAFLDLTGLPPTPREIADFATNESDTAYADLIDELMSRPSFGEHRARYWLDAARYGDTHGLHLDNYREIWPYRDWVIDAFNENKSFDEFTIEQIAGDLLPSPTQDQRIATGFNRCNVTTSEGGSIDEEYYMRYAVDRVATTSTVWMGLTAACAQCHDHKFDPITAKDFYQLYAFFNNTTQKAMDGNVKNSSPAIRVYTSAEQEAEAMKLEQKVKDAARTVETAIAATDVDGKTVAEVSPPLLAPGKTAEPILVENAGDFSKSEPFSIAFRFQMPPKPGRAVIAERTSTEHGLRGWRVVWEDQGIVVELIESHPNRIIKRGITRRFREGSNGHFVVTYDGSGHGNGLRLYSKGDLQSSRFVNEWHDSIVGDFRVDGQPLRIGGESSTKGQSVKISEFALFDRQLAPLEIKTLSNYSLALKAEKKPLEERDEKERKLLHDFLATWSDGPQRKTIEQLADLQTRLSRIESATPTTLVMQEKEEAAKAHILLRGEYDQKADEVTPDFPSFLPELDPDLPKNRLGLAQWLVHPDHPLTARVSVNRIWQELFGMGLVKTSEDFGTQGENPSHPELLDWLAASFIESGWDVKALYRTIMLSDTYQQSSVIPAGLAKDDPDNRLLARGPRFRMDAEVIRDQALSVSGLLDDAVGGPSVKPYQPAGIWSTVGYSNSNTQTFFQDFGPSGENRRSVYSFWKRTAQPPNLAIMDAPNRESCVMRRERTNTPLQALVLMNDPQFVRASRFLALRVLSEESDREARLDRIAELARGRSLDEAERTVVVNSLDQFRNTYESNPAAARDLLVDEVNASFSIDPKDGYTAPELAAWTMVASQFLNLDETLNKN